MFANKRDLGSADTWGEERGSWKLPPWCRNAKPELVSPDSSLPVHCAALGRSVPRCVSKAFAERWSLGGDATSSGDLILQLDLDVWQWLLLASWISYCSNDLFYFLEPA